MEELQHTHQVKIFRQKKTEIAAMEDPFLLLSALKDSDVIDEQQCKDVLGLQRMERVRALYHLLEELEKERSEQIPLFWQILQKDHIQRSSTELQAVWRSLLESVPDVPEIHGEGSISLVLPVKCGDANGHLYSGKLSTGEPSILVKDKWLKPSQFEALGGKGQNKKWKQSIHLNGCPLQDFLEDVTTQQAGATKKRTFGFQDERGRAPKSKQSKVPEASKECPDLETYTIISDSEAEESKEKIEFEIHAPIKKTVPDNSAKKKHCKDSKAKDINSVLPVKCGSLTGNLSRKRFLNEFRGKSIRTSKRWCTPVEFLREAFSSKKDAEWNSCIYHEQNTLKDLIKEKVLEYHNEDCQCVDCVADALDMNDDECQPCGQGGNLICCDGCPRSFHKDCHVPPITGTPSGEWKCTLCRYSEIRTNEPLFQRSQFLNLEIKDHLLRCQFLLLKIYCEPKSAPFLDNPCNLQRYCEVIEKPMWLEKIKQNLLNKKYKVIEEFVTDMHLIFSNCAKYNQNKSNTCFRKFGEDLKELFDDELKMCFCNS
ncbi:nuclear body protein SP140-like protein isoform X2 [Scleropages formosus]|uniref:Nuclear body protein SP140-like protein n=1 Tax=Scleropages formosus TaxID=113540 RepID=A0A8C9S350_SCLFO|nr:nuclear body protein SP140-like protein isoform X2 [Scleropages formosus]